MMNRLSIYTESMKAALKNELFSLKLNHAFTNAAALIEIKRRGSSFIHINKNGGSTIEQLLGFKDQLHIPYRVLEDYFGIEQAANLKTSSIVRNPFDRVVSQFHYRVQGNQMGYASKQITFKEFIIKVYKQRNAELINYPWMFARQVDWLGDYKSKIEHIGCLGYFENFQESAEIIARFHGVKITSNALPKRRKSTRRNDWREYYDNETLAIVLKYFEKDFETFGYQDSL